MAQFHVYAIRQYEVRRDDGDARPVFTFETPDWCNVVAFTEAGELLFVRQHRFGTNAPSLEIPGGLVDPGEDPLAAARRELREETGYEAKEIVSLGALAPNPAMQGNQLHCYVAYGCTPHREGQRLDDLEDCELVVLTRPEVEAAIDRGEIHHALVLAGWYLLERHERTRGTSR